MLAEALNRRWKVAKSFTESFTERLGRTSQRASQRLGRTSQRARGRAREHQKVEDTHTGEVATEALVHIPSLPPMTPKHHLLT